MAKVVLTQREDSRYDDVIGEAYHFPAQYLAAAKEAEGDFCIFYEPRRGNGRLAYWAVARIVRVRPDPVTSDHFYADLEGFLPFDHAVNLRRADGRFWESKVEKVDGSVSKGAMGVSVRRIPDIEFELILKAGFLDPYGATAPDMTTVLPSPFEVAEDQLEFERPLVEQVLLRPFRDRVFAKQVRAAYDSRCAVTGLKIINGGGRAEMEAAHIKPVERKGPDSVRNGLALSRTAHWLFDRGLISVDDDFRLLKAHGRLPEGVDRLFDPSGLIAVPSDDRHRPNPAFLNWHRENCFKG